MKAPIYSQGVSTEALKQAFATLKAIMDDPTSARGDMGILWEARKTLASLICEREAL